MRAGRGHLHEVRLNGLESLVFRSVEERRELPLMDAVVVDLLVVKSCGANQLVRPERMEERWAQTRISGQLPILGKPLGEGAGTDAQAEPLLDMNSNALARVAAIGL